MKNIVTQRKREKKEIFIIFLGRQLMKKNQVYGLF